MFLYRYESFDKFNICDDLLESQTIETGKIPFNMCVVDTSTDDPYISDYTIIAIANNNDGTIKCRFKFLSNGSWEAETGTDC